MRYDSEHKARTRDRVLKEAAAALRAEGPDRLGVAAVMKRAGLTHGGFYAHFRSRDELLSEAVDHMFKDRYEAFFADVDRVDPQTALHRLVNYYLSMRHRNARDQGCPIPILSGEFHRLPDAAQARFVRAVDRLTGGIETLLERAGVDAPRTRAVSAVAEMVGAIAISRTQDAAAAEETIASAKASVERKLGLVPPFGLDASSVGDGPGDNRIYHPNERP
ncbi:TetR/AcrR family transcriptional regulator [Sphingomonas sp. TX0543]|uniref:TetR/AcrR family transcriptional regulator n=1 Tax=unclassified Sphingomonas TaxID=196159 RepID=UPI001484CDF0|nr:TetR/AcrR family transcriptional regulator [Sphingomonas sp. 3P27F8]